jgi:hypothetical protein
MKIRIVIALLVASLMAGAAAAETVVVDGRLSVAPSSIARPARGMHMAEVEQRFGAPIARHAAVGRPPITRWDYPEYSVFFEGRTVIHTVVTGHDLK